MNQQIFVQLMTFYGLFLISAGVFSVVLIGFKAKTALFSGGFFGCLSLLTAYFIMDNVTGARLSGIVLALALFIVFSWRSTKTLFRIFEMIASGHEDLKGKGIAFLIIGLMAVVSLFVAVLQIIFYP